MTGPKLATQFATRVDIIARKLTAQAPEAYSVVAEDLASFKRDLLALDQRRVTERLNDPSKQKPRKRAAKKATKKAAKRAR